MDEKQEDDAHVHEEPNEKMKDKEIKFHERMTMTMLMKNEKWKQKNQDD